MFLKKLATLKSSEPSLVRLILPLDVRDSRQPRSQTSPGKDPKECPVQTRHPERRSQHHGQWPAWSLARYREKHERKQQQRCDHHQRIDGPCQRTPGERLREPVELRRLWLRNG